MSGSEEHRAPVLFDPARAAICDPAWEFTLGETQRVERIVVNDSAGRRGNASLNTGRLNLDQMVQRWLNWVLW